MSGIDWAGLVRAGLSPRPAGLGLAPAVFWALTPVELQMMLGAGSRVLPLTRARLEELAAAFPDRTGQGHGRDRDAGRPVGGAGNADGCDGGDGRQP